MLISNQLFSQTIDTGEAGFNDNNPTKLNKPATVIIFNNILWVADLYNHQIKQQKL